MNPIGTIAPPPPTKKQSPAKRQWLRFESEAEIHAWARSMMDLHGLKDWTFEISKLPQDTVGRCTHSKKLIQLHPGHARLRMTIVMNTILHEITHAIDELNLVGDILESDFNLSLEQAAIYAGVPLDKAAARFSCRRDKWHDLAFAEQAVAIGCLPDHDGGLYGSAKCRKNLRIAYKAYRRSRKSSVLNSGPHFLRGAAYQRKRAKETQQ